MLNRALGPIETLEGRPFIRVRPGAEGHALYGPYRNVDAGAYRIEFEIIASESGSASSQICALLEVTFDGGSSYVTYDFVTYEQLASGRKIGLRFDLDQARELEFRVFVRGDAELLIGDEPTLVGLSSEEAIAAPPRAITAGQKGLRHLFVKGAAIGLEGDVAILRADRERLPEWVLVRGDRDRIARQVIETVGYRGPGQNLLYRAFLGTEQPAVSPPQRVPFSSTLCQQAHFAFDQYRFWARAMKEPPQFSRKQWEFVYIAQILFERGFLTAGKRGLVFGAGQEPLPALFASYGVEILATDQAADAAEQSGWVATGQHTFDLGALNQRDICTDHMFSQLVSFMPVDMNAIPAELDGQFDFCWSACALEHLGSIEHGLAFIENSMRTLRPGGVAVHTTEFNLSSNEDTFESEFCCFFRRRDIEALVARLEKQGLEVAPIDWRRGDGFAERVVDLPPYAGGEPHIRLRSQDYDCTSIGLIISKPENI